MRPLLILGWLLVLIPLGIAVATFGVVLVEVPIVRWVVAGVTLLYVMGYLGAYLIEANRA